MKREVTTTATVTESDEIANLYNTLRLTFMKGQIEAYTILIQDGEIAHSRLIRRIKQPGKGVILKIPFGVRVNES